MNSDDHRVVQGRDFGLAFPEILVLLGVSSQGSVLSPSLRVDQKVAWGEGERVSEESVCEAGGEQAALTSSSWRISAIGARLWMLSPHPAMGFAGPVAPSDAAASRDGVFLCHSGARLAPGLPRAPSRRRTPSQSLPCPSSNIGADRGLGYPA